MSLDTPTGVRVEVTGHIDRGQSLMLLDTPKGVRLYVSGHTGVRILCYWIRRRGSEYMSQDAQRSESYVTGHTDRGQMICQWTHRGQNLMSLDTPTGVGAHVTGHTRVKV